MITVERVPDDGDFESLFDNDNSFNMGVRASAEAMKEMLDEEFHTDAKDGRFPIEWLGHIIAEGGACGCSFEVEYDSKTAVEINLCSTYDHMVFRREWFRKWHNMTHEQLMDKLRAEDEERQRKEQAAAEKDRQYRLKKLRELAAEFGVNPELLP